MKAKKAREELRGLASDELAQKARDEVDALFKLRYGAMAESVDNTRKIRDARKRIARINTVLRERELAAARGVAAAGPGHGGSGQRGSAS